MSAGPRTVSGPGHWHSGDRVEARGRHWRVLSTAAGDECSAVRLHVADGDAAGAFAAAAPAPAAGIVLLEPFDRLRTSTSGARVRLVRLGRLLRTITGLAAATHPASGLRAAATAAIRLLPYQLAPALATLVHGSTRLLIADEVGLGKTIQAGLVIVELAARQLEPRVLVLTPAGLRDQWRAELSARFACATVDADARWLRSVGRDRPSDVNPWSLGGVYVASHDFVKRPEVLRPLEDATWDLVVVDEAHAMGPATDRRAAADAIARRSRRVLLLTATPPWDDAHALESLCRIGSHGRGRSRVVLFRRTRAEVTHAVTRRSRFLAVEPSAAERRMHALLERYTRALWTACRARGDDAAALVAVVLRKRALSSAGSLAGSIRRRLALLAGPPPAALEQPRLPLADEDPLEDDEPTATLSLPGLPDARREQEWLTAIAAAADAAAGRERKAHRLARLLARVREPVLVFTEYRDTLVRLQGMLAGEGRDVLVMHGGMSASERARVQARFNAGSAVLLATDAAAEGLNLHHACRLLVHYELPWNLSRLEQRAGRLDRLGQARPVHEIALLADHTSERFVLAPLARKAADARRRRDGAGFVATLTENQIAARILEDVAPGPTRAPEPEHSTAPPPGGIDADAEAEGRRLRQIRTWLAALGPTPADDPAATACPALTLTPRHNSRLPQGLTLVYTLRVAHRSGGQAHGRLLVLHVTLDARFRHHRRKAALRRALAGIVASPPARLESALRAAVDRERAIASSACDRAGAELRGREEDILHVYASSAMQLVQAGLFDDRAVRDAARRRRLIDEQRGILGSAGGGGPDSMALTITLAAALLVRQPRPRR
jgi:superfamily II DNA or RNA helicase